MIRAALIAVVILAITAGSFPVRAFTSAHADILFEAHTQAFYHLSDGGAFYRKSTEGNTPADFWTEAEQMEMVLDAYERTGNARQLGMFTNLFRGFLTGHGTTWEDNPFNDDIMWMVIALTRAHLLTGNAEFRAVAKSNFDLCYARAASTNLGGGLWWKAGVRSKNACVNGPGAIAAFLMGKATGKSNYFIIATNLFLWERATLFDPATGRISDSIRENGRLAHFASTYNQGTFVGAANFLGYTNEARLAALYTMNEMCRDGYMPPGDETGDGGGFNGICARWIARFMKDRGEQSTFEPWLQKNAAAAWQARRGSDNLCWCRWPKTTPEDERYSWGCSSAVVMLQVVRPTEGAIQATNSPTPAVEARAFERATEKIRTECIQGRRIICGRIVNVRPDGLVVESGYTDLMRQSLGKTWLIPGTVAAKQDSHLIEGKEPGCVCVGLVLVNALPKSRLAKPKLYDYIVIQAYPAGPYTYISMGNIRRTIRCFSATLATAIKINRSAMGIQPPEMGAGR